MHGPRVKYLAAFMNSSLINWYVNKTAVTSGMGTTRWFGVTVEAIPIPLTATNSRTIDALVDDIILFADKGASKKVEELEASVEDLIYQSYGFTVNERNAINKGKH